MAPWSGLWGAGRAGLAGDAYRGTPVVVKMENPNWSISEIDSNGVGGDGDDGEEFLAGAPGRRRRQRKRRKNAKQITWILLLKAHRAAGCLAWLSSGAVALGGAARRRVGAGRTDSDAGEGEEGEEEEAPAPRPGSTRSSNRASLCPSSSSPSSLPRTPTARAPSPSRWTRFTRRGCASAPPTSPRRSCSSPTPASCSSSSRAPTASSRASAASTSSSGASSPSPSLRHCLMPRTPTPATTPWCSSRFQCATRRRCISSRLQRYAIWIGRGPTSWCRCWNDSDELTTKGLIKEEVEKWRQNGARIVYRHRVLREGYKAGNLKSAMGCSYVKGYGYVAIFDADFQPYPDFLKHCATF